MIVLSLYGSGCVGLSTERSQENLKVGVSREWAQPGGASTHADSGARGPLPPLRHAWSFAGDRLVGDPLRASASRDSVTGWWRAGFGSPVAGDQQIIVASDKLYCLGLDGRIKWRFPGRESVFPADPILLGPQVVTAFPAAPDRLRVVGLDRRSGSVGWSTDLPAGSVQAAWVAGTSRAIIVAAAGRSEGPNVWALDGAGAIMWTKEAPGSVNSVPAVAEDTVAVRTTTGLHVLGSEDGDIRWSHVGPSPRVDVSSWRLSRSFIAVDLPVIAGQSVIARFQRRTEFAESDRIVRFDRTSGRLLNELEFPFGITTYSVPADMLYVGETDRIAAYRIEDFERVWDIRLPKRIDTLHDPLLPLQTGVMAAVFAEGRKPGEYLAYFGADGEIIARTPVPADLPGGLAGSPGFPSSPRHMISTGGAILLATDSGQLFAFVASV